MEARMAEPQIRNQHFLHFYTAKIHLRGLHPAIYKWPLGYLAADGGFSYNSWHENEDSCVPCSRCGDSR